MFSSIRYPSRLYRDFSAIDLADFRARVRFFERFEQSIRQLDFEEYFDLTNQYAQALYEIGEYEKCILMSDWVIETSLRENFTHFKGNEVFEWNIYQKSAAHFSLKNYAESQYLLSELLRINPDSADYRLALEVCLRQRRLGFLRPLRAISVGLILVSLVLYGFNELVLRFFYEAQSVWIATTSVAILAAAVIFLSVGYGWHRFKIWREIQNLLKIARQRPKK